MYVYLGAESPFAMLAVPVMFAGLILISVVGTLLALNGAASSRRRRRAARAVELGNWEEAFQLGYSGPFPDGFEQAGDESQFAINDKTMHE